MVRTTGGTGRRRVAPKPEFANQQVTYDLTRKFDFRDVDTKPLIVNPTAGLSFGCYFNAAATSQEIGVGGDFITWTQLERQGVGNWISPIFPVTEATIPLAGYYDITAALRWDTWALGGTVNILVNGAVVWPPFIDSVLQQWTFAGASYGGAGVAKGILCAPGDLVQVFVNHGDSSPQDLAGAFLNIELVDRIPGVPGQCLFIFTEDGTFDWDLAGQPATLSDVWIIAGGGAGGAGDDDWKGGGGGGGGLLHLTNYAVSGDCAVVVGAGGTAAHPADNGEDSSFDGQVATGGGGAGAFTTNIDGDNGGCGGGAATAGLVSSGTGGTGTQGGDGGDAPSAGNAGGGGGGIDANGGDGAGGVGGDGGIGIDLSAIVGPGYGDNGWFGGGGGGAGPSGGGAGGQGGGGAGGTVDDTVGVAGLPNSGGGGGGGRSSVYADGGSGIVIVKVC